MKSRIGMMVALALSAPALPATAQVTFAAVPAPEDVAAAYPAKATTEHLVGRAVISCRVTTEAALTDCQVTSETPDGYGFGAAALALAPKFRLQLGNLPERIAIPLRFEAPLRIVDAIFGKMPGGYGGTAGPYYPDQAFRAGAQGYAILDCRLAATGLLSACSVAAEAPAGLGFSDAARKMMERKVLTAAPRVVDGVPMDGEQIRVRVPFQMKGRK